MVKVLIGSEFISDFSLETIILPLAKSLVSQGHEVTLLVDLEAIKVKAPGINLIQVPKLNVEDRFVSNAALETFADIFVASGFDDKEELTNLALKINDIIDKVNPDITILNAAPFIGMCTLGRVPSIAVGNTFVIPPVATGLPNIRFWNEGKRLSSIMSENNLLATINHVRTRIYLPKIGHVADLFNLDQTVVCGIAELDGYLKSRSIMLNYYSVVEEDVKLEKGEHIYFELSSDVANLQEILDAIKESKIPAKGYIYGNNREQYTSQGSKFFIYKNRPPLKKALSHASIVVHHGSSYLTELISRSGNAQILLFRTLEHMLNGIMLNQVAAAHIYNIGQFDKIKFIDSLNEINLESAKVFSNSIKPAENAIEFIVSSVNQIAKVNAKIKEDVLA